MNWDVKKSEWDRLLELHEGAKHEKHTAMLLMFAREGLAGGYRVKLLRLWAFPKVSL